MRLDKIGNPLGIESKQYLFYFVYQSVLCEVEVKFELENGLRFNPSDISKKHPGQHVFLYSFSCDPLFDGNQLG